MSRPRPALYPGARLAVVAPSSPFDRDTFRTGIAWLQTRYEVRLAAGIFERTGFLAGSDANRLQQLHQALADPEIDAILCARGGYGATRLLPGLDMMLVSEARKPIIGFSDITALHAQWARAGVPSWHAKMVANLGRSSDDLRRRWVEAIEESAPSLWRLTPIGKSGAVAEGRLVGGNLAVLAALLGTPYEPPVDGALLFLEDIGERPYRVDRMLTSLQQAGWFDRCAGIILGAFAEATPESDGVTVEEVFVERLSSLGIPVAGGLPAGHIDDNQPLPLGVDARLENDTLIVVT